MRFWLWLKITVVVAVLVSCSAAANEAATTTSINVEGYKIYSDPLVDEWWVQATVVPTTTARAVPPVSVAPSPSPASSENELQTGGTVWDDLAWCESRGNWNINSGNGFGGGLQFMHQSRYSTWRSFGGEEFAEHPWEASREQQIVVAERVLQSSGWRAWPGCARKMGLL